MCELMEEVAQYYMKLRIPYSRLASTPTVRAGITWEPAINAE